MIEAFVLVLVLLTVLAAWDVQRRKIAASFAAQLTSAELKKDREHFARVVEDLNRTTNAKHEEFVRSLRSQVEDFERLHEAKLAVVKGTVENISQLINTARAAQQGRLPGRNIR